MLMFQEMQESILFISESLNETLKRKYATKKKSYKNASN